MCVKKIVYLSVLSGYTAEQDRLTELQREATLNGSARAYIKWSIAACERGMLHPWVIILTKCNTMQRTLGFVVGVISHTKSCLSFRSDFWYSNPTFTVQLQISLPEKAAGRGLLGVFPGAKPGSRDQGLECVKFVSYTRLGCNVLHFRLPGRANGRINELGGVLPSIVVIVRRVNSSVTLKFSKGSIERGRRRWYVGKVVEA